MIYSALIIKVGAGLPPCSSYKVNNYVIHCLSILIMILLTSCKHQSSDSIYLVEKAELVFPAKKNTFEKSGFKVYYDGDDLFLNYYNSLTNTIDFYNIENQQFFTIIPSGIPTNHIKKGAFDYYIQTLDSIFFLINNRIYLLLDEGRRFEKWTIDLEIPGFNENYNLVAIGEQLPIRYYAHNLYIFISSSTYNLHEFNSRIKYYDLPPYIRVSFKSDSILQIEPIGEYSSNEKDGRFYGTMLPLLQVNNSGDVLISNSHEKEIFVFNDNGKMYKRNCYAPYFKPSQEYPRDSSLQNYAYYQKFILGQNEFSRFIYDPFNDYFIRVYSEGIEFSKTEYLRNTMNDKPWTILIYDSVFNLICLRRFANSNTYSSVSILPVMNGLLIRKKRHDENTQSFSYFEYAEHSITAELLTSEY